MYLNNAFQISHVRPLCVKQLVHYKPKKNYRMFMTRKIVSKYSLFFLYVLPTHSSFREETGMEAFATSYKVKSIIFRITCRVLFNIFYNQLCRQLCNILVLSRLYWNFRTLLEPCNKPDNAIKLAVNSFCQTCDITSRKPALRIQFVLSFLTDL